MTVSANGPGAGPRTAEGGNWGGGYVTDIPYLPGYYRHQSPLHLELGCLLGGVVGLGIGDGSPLSYVELGCGHGFGALALAACNPSWQVTGIDFSPAHIAAARAFGAEAGIANARFIEADLAILAVAAGAEQVPQADVVTLHGLWSWVSDPVRAGIVRLLDTKVRPGGVVYVSYNSLPAWQSALGMQRLVREAGERLVEPSDRQAQAGFATLRALVAANVYHLHGLPFVESLLEHAERGSPAYLAHEYMNRAWRPCFHADVVAALAGAKLDWVASAQLFENFPDLTLPDEVRPISARFGDPIMRELIKDLCLPRGLRQDVFVRGARRLSAAERDAALGDVVLGLIYPEAEFRWEFAVPPGRAALEPAFFGPVVAALGKGPRRVRDLLALPGLPRRDNPSELVGMLVGSDQVLPMLAPPGDPDPRVARFNRVAASRLPHSGNLDHGAALAASGTGAPLPCTMLDLFVAARLAEERTPDPAAWAAALGADRPDDERQRLAAFIGRLVAERAPIWRRLGAIGASPPASC